MERAPLLPVDAAEVTILVDTFVDVLLAGTQVARRAPLAYDWTERDQLRAIGPDWLVSGHCTGWRATHELARVLPEAYIQPSIGTTLHFASP